MNTRVQIIERNGEPEYAVLPIEEYRHLLELAEEAEEIRAGNQAKAELATGADELIPAEVVERLLIGGESPVLVWREYRGLTQERLAREAGVGKSYISQIESRKKTGSVTVLKRIARALQVDLDDLVLPEE